MSGIQPHTLSDEELAKYVYLQLGKPVPSIWVAELLVRLHEKMDAQADSDTEDAY